MNSICKGELHAGKLIMSSSGEASSLPVYTWDDIGKHNTAGSLWTVMDGKVYDITSFQDEVGHAFPGPHVTKMIIS